VRAIHPLEVMDEQSHQPLTRAQLDFADKHGAHAGLSSAVVDGSVFFYREYEAGSERWLVEPDGGISDVAWFGAYR
jgi:hypothetical protein